MQIPVLVGVTGVPMKPGTGTQCVGETSHGNCIL
jgi:hypothetical protein